MPLIRAAAVPSAAPETGAAPLLAQLRDAEPAQRRAAARQLGRGGAAGERLPRETAMALAAQLQHEADACVREALFGALAEQGGVEAAPLLGGLLHHHDPALRNGALDALKQIGVAAAAAVEALLADADPVVRILAAEALRDWPPAEASPLIARQLVREAEANVCGGLFDIAIALGDAGLLPALAACAARFTGEPFLNFAYDVARDALGKPAGAAP